MHYIYFVQAEDGGPVKVGVAKDPQQRLRQLQTGSASHYTIRGLLSFKSRRACFNKETQLHHLFRRWRVNLEWFELNPLLIGYMLIHGFFPAVSFGDIINILWRI